MNTDVGTQFNEALAEYAATHSRPLYDVLWHEGEVCCMCGDSNRGKSILAVQMADAIARAEYRVVYFDFKLSDKQFQRRYTADDGSRHTFPDTFFRAEIDPESLDENYDGDMLEYIEQVAEERRADVLIIDDLDMLGCMAAKNNAGTIGMHIERCVNGLAPLARRCAVSVLVVGDEYDLFTAVAYHSAFALRRSARDRRLFYIEQLHCEASRLIYGRGNAVVCTIERDGAFPHLVAGWLAPTEVLRSPLSSTEWRDVRQTVKALAQVGKLIPTIATTMTLSIDLVKKILDEDTLEP